MVLSILGYSYTDRVIKDECVYTFMVVEVYTLWVVDGKVDFLEGGCGCCADNCSVDDVSMVKSRILELVS